ncbi:MAG: hypothetical protein ACPGOV_11845 [Magnetovibrionaceae bacterium]
MTALTRDRATQRRSGDIWQDPVAAATTIYAGSIVCLDAAGNLVPGSTATTLKVRGRAEEMVDNASGLAGDKTCRSRRGIHAFENSAAADEITRADIGNDAWIVDDQTLAKTDGGATRSKAGRIVDLDECGVWIEFA